MELNADVATRIGQIAGELRALAGNGLHYATDPYDLARYQRFQALAAGLLSAVDGRTGEEIGQIFSEDVGVRTPLVAVDGATFDEHGRLLVVERADSGSWCIPGGASDVGESPSAGVEREVWEETGLTVRATRLLAVFDNFHWKLSSITVHAYHLLFECEVVGGALSTSIETSDLRWVTEAEALALPLYLSHVHKIPEAFRLHRSPDAPAAFH